MLVHLHRSLHSADQMAEASTTQTLLLMPIPLLQRRPSLFLLKPGTSEIRHVLRLRQAKSLFLLALGTDQLPCETNLCDKSVVVNGWIDSVTYSASSSLPREAHNAPTA
jgi:hypothetical protein